jgi:hypothetical protein
MLQLRQLRFSGVPVDGSAPALSSHSLLLDADRRAELYATALDVSLAESVIDRRRF